MDGPQFTFQEHQAQRNILLWTKAYRLAGLVTLGLLIFLIANVTTASCKPSCIGGPEKINPNTAPLASLVRLPGIGKARAMDIIHFRQAGAGSKQVFKTVHDMEQIKGIGPKTAEKISPRLVFEEAKIH